MRNTDIFHQRDNVGCVLTALVAIALVVAIGAVYGLFFGWLLTLVWNNWLIAWTHWPPMPLWVGFIVVFVLSALGSSGSQAKDK